MPDAIFDQTCDVDVSPGGASRALVLATPRSETILFPAIRPDARFIAQLIAAATHVPQTRTLRRTAPEDAATTYSDVSGRRELRVTANGLALARVA
jgi:hypothetical protein